MTAAAWHRLRLAFSALIAALAAGCGGSGGGTLPGAEGAGPEPCDGNCATATSFLSAADVERVIAQGVAEAAARGRPATIAVVDRVGNVLGVFRMTGAPETVTITSGTAASGGLEGVEIVPDTLAAIAKAVTGAYLSSEGNAFSTRTAGQIVQEHFNPGEQLAPGGPLLGVQFSQLPCSDLAGRWAGGVPGTGPKRSPLGLSADPGGFPLYLAGTPVGGVGVITDGVYGLDRAIGDRDQDTDELVALAASFGFAAPADRRADRITVDGKTLRFSDATFGDLQSDPGTAPAFAAVDGIDGALVAVPGYAASVVQAGVAFGQPESGVRPDALGFAGLDAFVLVDDGDVPRFDPAAGSEPVDGLTTDEVRELLAQALGVANRARAQIRRPLNSPARVSVSVVDSTGTILGIVRGRDAPVFGIDVSVQKARTAALLSSANAASSIGGVPDAVYLDGGLSVLSTSTPGDYVTRAQEFLGQPSAFGDGAIAFAARSAGNLARPFYPDGVDGRDPGPFSKALSGWSAFSTGLQLDLVYNGLIQHVAFVLGAAADVPQNCTGLAGFDAGFAPAAPIAGLANGMQIFPGGVPIYRGSTLVGALGVSGDGVDQDDMIGFLGVAEAGRLLGSFGNAPTELRADQLTPAGARLRYVNCPVAPFLDSTSQDECREQALVLANAAKAAEPCPTEQASEPDRRRPGEVTAPFVPTPCNPDALRPPETDLMEFAAYPDRWRLVSMLGHPGNLANPWQGNNWLKGDQPAFGDDWFVSLTGISDTVVEPRRLPVPVGGPVTGDPGSLDVFGQGEQLLLSETVLLEGVLYQGNTVFMPPAWEFRIIPAFNLNYARAEEVGLLEAPADADTTRRDGTVGLQGLFVDRHLRDVSARYDFDSVRVGIQPFSADFRGFLFLDSPLGIRLFGTRDNNRYQYNLAWFRRLDKDINSGLNAILDRGLPAIRDDDVFIANLYAQDTPVPGFTSQVVAAYNRNREGGDVQYDNNGFIQRPASIGIEQGRDYDVLYLGYNGDGHYRRINMSVSGYVALGDETRSTFSAGGADIAAFMAGAEVSRDQDWARLRVSAVYASGDDDPFDDRATGFDAIFENPMFAGADTSFWIRQPVPLIGGGRVGLSGRNGLLNSLRSSKELGQSNFSNPGTVLFGIGADLDLSPTLRVSANANELWFADTATVEVARNQGAIDEHIGLDASVAVTWRPLAIQNVVVRLSAAALLPGKGYEQLYADEVAYSVLGNLVVTY